MLYREIISVCSQIHTKHINTLCGQNVVLLNVKLVVHIVTAGLWMVNNNNNNNNKYTVHSSSDCVSVGLDISASETGISCNIKCILCGPICRKASVSQENAGENRTRYPRLRSARLY